MGRAKQLLALGGKTLVRRAAEAAVAAVPGPVVVVLGCGADRIAEELRGLAVIVVNNPEWAAGPGTSVRAGLAAVDSLPGVTGVVFLLCDQPGVTADHIRDLIEAWSVGGRPMAASEYAGVVGVPAVFGRDCFPALRALSPAAGAKQLLDRHPEHVTRVPFPAGADDLDTPADYARWRGRHEPDTEETHAPGP